MAENFELVLEKRINELQNKTYKPEDAAQYIEKLTSLTKQISECPQLIDSINDIWREELLEGYLCVNKLQQTIFQYEEELTLMIQQMEALVKCSLLIKQYSLYLKEEVDKVADKIDKEGLDQRIDELVNLLDEIKPKKHLKVVQEGSVIKFPGKKEAEE